MHRRNGGQARSLFSLGQVLATPGALAALEAAGQAPQEFLDRHRIGDWGDLDPEDIKENELALQKGFRLFSAYTLADGSRIWIISEADRASTTIFTPSEY